MESIGNETISTPVPRAVAVRKSGRRWRQVAGWCVGVFCLIVLIIFVISNLEGLSSGQIKEAIFSIEFLGFVLCGFAAQMIDGALGLGYGLTCTTALLGFGVPPAMVSSSIHTAEVFATGISGYSHYRFGNVNKRLAKALLWPGLAGAIAGSLLLVVAAQRYAEWTSLVLGVYCFFLAASILYKAIRHTVKKKKVRHLSRLAAAGGFFDAFGGGGWGPLVTSTLISNGRSPRFVIGTVSLVEFFITLATALTFLATLGVTHWHIMLGLIVGSAVAAPIAARLAGKLPRRTGLILIGTLVMIWSIYLISRKLMVLL
jgi:uncharacterized membrane protein YfcA